MKPRNAIIATILAAFALCLCAPLAAAESKSGGSGEASALLVKADSVLIPKNAEFRWSLKDEREGEPIQENRFLGFKKGDLKYLFFDYYPDSSFGQCHLRIDAAIWQYLPLADDTIKTSYKSAFLNSGLSYADVMYNELARYYEAKLLDADAKASGLDGEYPCYKLELTAKKGADGYAKIVTYIDEERFLTVRREYYSLSGQKLKEIAYGGYEFSGSAVTAFQLEVKNELDKRQKTSARFWNMKSLSQMPEKYFSLNFARTWQPKVEADKP
jgi:hypothetical protein